LIVVGGGVEVQLLVSVVLWSMERLHV
jgi:hypothetical protein